MLDENILAEAARQPQLFVRASRYRVEKMRDRAVAAARLDHLRSELALRIRAKKNEAGEKITEAALKERLERHSQHRKLREEMERAYEQEELSKLLLDAYRQRRDAIRILADARNYEAIRGTAEIERIESQRKLRKRARELEQIRDQD